MMRKFCLLLRSDTRWVWVSLGVITLLVRVFFGYFPQVCEQVYARGLFPILRVLVDHTLGYMPFPNLYLLVGLLLFWAGFSLRKVYRHWKETTFKTKFRQFSLSLCSFVGLVLTSFMWLWGFNYARVDFETQSGLNPKPLDLQTLETELLWSIERLESTRQQIPNADTNALSDALLPTDLETETRACLEQVLTEMGFSTWGQVRGRAVRPNGLLMRLGATGVYLPWVSEGHIDAALPACQKPFTMAHELGHGYGFGDEAVCNFLGFAACARSKNPLLQYNAYLSYYRYLAGELHAIAPETLQKHKKLLSNGTRNDLKDLYAVYERYPCFFPDFQRIAYNAYLQTQGVKEGVLSYNRMVLLVAAWRAFKPQN